MLNFAIQYKVLIWANPLANTSGLLSLFIDNLLSFAFSLGKDKFSFGWYFATNNNITLQAMP